MKHFVLIRGLGRESQHWGEFPNYLERATQGKVYCVDLPGTGKRLKDPSPFDLSLIVDHVRAVHTLPQTFSLVGISFGGMIALNWAERFPKEVENLVLINSSASNLSGVLKRLTPSAIRKLLKFGFIKDAGHREALVLDMITNHPQDKEKILRHFTGIATDRPVRYLTYLSQLYCARSFHAPKPQARALVLRSLADKLCDPSCSEALAKHLNATLKSHPSAGHDLPLDDPQWVSAEIAAFCLR